MMSLKNIGRGLASALVLAACAVLGASVAYADFTVGENLTLTSDTDWRSKGTVTINPGVTVNLNGHTLTLSNLIGLSALPLEDLTTTDASRASYSKTEGTAYSPASNAFNNNFSRVANGTGRILLEKRYLPMGIDYDFGEGNAKVVNMYKIYCGPIPNYTIRCPKSWTVQGSNDKVNWTVLDTQNSETGWTTANSASECRTMTFANTTAYRYYRFEINAAQDNSDGYVEIVQLEYFSFSAVTIPPTIRDNPLEDLTTTDAVRVSYSKQDTIGATPASNAFNNNFIRSSGRILLETKNLPMGIDYDFGEGNATVVDRYKVYCGPIPNYTHRCPKSWTVQGSNDKVNWTVLDTQNSETGWTTANNASECRTMTFANTTAYRYYRFEIKAAQDSSDGYVEIVQLEYFSTLSAGKLCLDIPEGVTVDNQNVVIGEGVRLVKEGAGTFVASRADQTYCGGTHVVEGMFRCGAGEVANELGVDPIVVVEKDAVFDVNGWRNISTCGITLAGGTLTNTGYDFGSADAQISKLTLTADSSVTAPHYLGLIAANSGAALLDLGGHTLDISIDSLFRFSNAEALSPGTINISRTTDDALLSFVNKASNLENVNLEFATRFAVYCSPRVGGVRVDDKTVGYDQSLPILVCGELTLLNDAYSGFELQDGATLDLSERTTALNVVSTLANQRLTFAENATITVNLNGRTPPLGECLVAWTLATRPADNVAFKFDDETAKGDISLVVTDLGIFYGADPNSRDAQYAVWTGDGEAGNLSDPGNWSCTNAAGRVIDGGLPCASTILRFTGPVDVQIPSGSELLFGRVEFDNCQLMANCNWCGLSNFMMKEGSTLNLNGHTLTVAGFDGSGTIVGNPLVDLTTTDTSRASYSKTEGTAYSPASNAFNNNFSRVANNTGRILLENKYLPVGIDYDFGEGNATVVDRYKVYCGPIPNYTIRCPKSWTVQGSNDKVNWTVLDTRKSETGWTTANSASECRTMAFSNTTAYRYYRFEINAAQDNSDGYVEIVQLEYFSTLTAGTLCLDIPEGVTVDNQSVVIGDGVRLVKEGAGTFVASKANQTYCGGTHVVAGTFRCGAGTVANELGVAPTVVVEKDGVFDVNGWRNIATCGITLAGGTLTNTGYDFNSNESQISKLTLTADSSVTAPHYLGLIAANNGVALLDLGDHTLDLSIGSTFRFSNTEALSPGTIRVSGEKNSAHLVFFGGASRLQPVNLVQTNPFELYNYTTVTIGDLRLVSNVVMVCDNQPNGFKVYGTLALLNDAYTNMELQDGSTLDLSERTSALNVVSTQANQGLTFVENATVTIDLGSKPLRDFVDRQPGIGMKVVAWDEKPANLQAKQFKVKANGRDANMTVTVADDGLYLRSGLLILFR